MLDILRKKGFQRWLVRWIRAFLTDRTTTLVIQGKESQPFAIKAGVPQGSTLSPILFNFYAHELLEICNQPKARISAIGFADDTNILIYGTSTKSKYRMLERIHERCLKWAERHGMKFSPGKYELTHFTRSHTKFNVTAGVNFGSVRKEPSGEVRILGVWLDTKLTWSAHARKVTRKATSQIGALTRLTASTWGASFAWSRQIYSSVVRPMLTYGAMLWHSPTEGKAKGVAAKLRTVQNKCLRTIAGAYSATPIQALETGTFTPPIDLYLDSRIAAFQRRLQASPITTRSRGRVKQSYGGLSSENQGLLRHKASVERNGP
ncbi:reverse transcriptase protein [Rutstroemia sp. NJR-2017a WRK4]|nr:reverse transcriptase protein [Rutstroemia sp. NJR-2017a WRK4]